MITKLTEIDKPPIALQRYLPPSFADGDRLARMQALFPAIDEMHRHHAQKNNYPGYAFGIVCDGHLAHSGTGGFIDREKQIPVTPHSLFRFFHFDCA